MTSSASAYTSGYVPEAQQRRMASSLMQERMTAPRMALTSEQADVDVLALDVPAELAYVFSKIHAWTPPHGEHHVTQTAGSLHPIDQHFLLQDDINDYIFTKYIEQYFRQDQRFQILKFIHDPQLNSKQETLLGDYIAQMGMPDERLRDEIFCQLMMQTFLTSSPEFSDSAWLLLANCLCCFHPSQNLAPYLLKYVSDQAPERLKVLYQHKVLECLNRKYLYTRTYPPCLLEWKTNRKVALMALGAEFSDGTLITGHVTSYTSGEDYAAHLLKCRDMTDGIYGWTVALDDHGDTYECAGHEYVFDPISEIEVPPQFPFAHAYNLVDLCKGPNAPVIRRNQFKQMAHDVFRSRLMELEVSELPHPVHIPPSKLLRHESLLKSTSTHGGSVNDDTWFTSRAELLAPNVLNKRSGTNNPSLSSRSALNVRYIEAAKQAEHSYVPPPPPVGAPPVGGVQRHASHNNGLPLAGPTRSRDESYSSTSTTPVMKSNAPAIFSVSVDETRSGDYATSPITIEDSVGGGGNVPLSKDSRMNDRYTKHVVVDPSRMGLLAGDSKLNQRYAQKGIAVNGDGNTRAPVQNGNAAPPHGGKQGRYMMNPKAVNGGKKSGGGGGGSSSVHSGSTDPVQWITDNFDPVLDSNTSRYEAQAQSLATRMKGLKRLENKNGGSSNMADKWCDDIVNGAITGDVNDINVSDARDDEQRARDLSQRLKGGGSDDNKTSSSEESELQRQLKAKQLETQLLQESLQAELLKQQLRQLSDQGTPAGVQPAVSDVMQQLRQLSDQDTPAGAQPVSTQATTATASTTSTSTKSGPKPPPFTVVKVPAKSAAGATGKSPTKPTTSSTQNQRSTVKFSEEVAHIPRPASPLSPRSSEDTRSPSPSPRVASPQRRASPPVNRRAAVDVTDAADKNFTGVPMAVKETDRRTIVDRSGVSKRVRIGKVEWPPRQEEVVKPEVEVGRLLISEQKEKDPDLIRGDFERAQQRINDMMKSKQEKTTVPPKERPDFVATDIQAKRATLEQQLTSINNKQETEPAVPITTCEDEPIVPDVTDASATVGVSMREAQTQTGTVRKFEHATETSAFVPYTRDANPTTHTPPPPSPPSAAVADTEPKAPEPEPDLNALLQANTVLYPQLIGPFYTYTNVPWKLRVRKEVFSPREQLTDPLLTALVFAQIVQDVFADSCQRILTQDKINMRREMERLGVNPHTAFDDTLPTSLRQKIISDARVWPLYFSRLYAVNGGSRHPTTNYVAISHDGYKLVSHDQSAQAKDPLHVVKEIGLNDVDGQCLPRDGVVQVSLMNGEHVLLYTPRDEQLFEHMQSYRIENNKSNVAVRGVDNHVTYAPDSLSFRDGDVITVDATDRNLPSGWLYGACHGKCGRFPAEMVTSMAVDPADMPDLNQYPMLEYALLNFQESPFRVQDVQQRPVAPEAVKERALEDARKQQHGIGPWHWKRQLELVTWKPADDSSPLLLYTDGQLNREASLMNRAIQEYMRDVSADDMSADPIESAHDIFRIANAYPELKDEMFCMLAKQVTDNNSHSSSSVALGWRLLSLLTAYFHPSQFLYPHLNGFLQHHTASPQATYYLIAKRCMSNLETTFEYGGRRNVPSEDELHAIRKGRYLRRIICLLPSGAQVQLPVKAASVVQHAIDEISGELGIPMVERDEYTLFYVTESDHRYCPMTRDEYVMDVFDMLHELKKTFYLLYQRTSYVYPINLNGGLLYVEMMYSELIDNYMDGLYLIQDGKYSKKTLEEAALLGAYKTVIDGKALKPLIESDIADVVPAALIKAEHMSEFKWVRHISAKMTSVANLHVVECRSRFIETLQSWDHIGSTFFFVKKISGPDVKKDSYIVAVNKHGVDILREKNRTCVARYSYDDLLSVKRETDSKNSVILYLKQGSPSNPRVTKMETRQASAIESLILQYMDVLRKSREVEDVEHM